MEDCSCHEKKTRNCRFVSPDSEEDSEKKKSELQDRLYLHIKERVSHISFSLNSVYILQLFFLFTQQNLKQLKR